MRLLFAGFVLAATGPRDACAAISSFSWWSNPSWAQAGDPYEITAYAEFALNHYSHYDHGYVRLSRNWEPLLEQWGSPSALVSRRFTDSGNQTISYFAEADSNGDYRYLPEHHVQIAGARPRATVSVDGYASGAVITRPAGGNVTVTVRYQATDPDGDLSGIRPQIWHPSGSLDNNAGVFVSQGGSSGEVVRSVVLDQSGDWWFWTDAQDGELAPSGQYVTSGSWNAGFRIRVEDAQTSPSVNFTASHTVLQIGETMTLTSTAADGNGDITFHSFWWDQGHGLGWTSPQFNWDYPANAAGWSNISNVNGSVANGSSQTITAAWTAFAPGTYSFHSNAYDSRNVWGNGAVHTVRVTNTPPLQWLSVAETVFVGQGFQIQHTTENPAPLSHYLTGFRIFERREDVHGNAYQDWTELNYESLGTGNRSFTANRPAPDRPGIIRYHFRAWNQWMTDVENVSERTVIVPNRNPALNVQILDSAQNAIGLQGNGNARIAIDSQFYVRLDGSDSDGRLMRLYSRVSNPAGVEVEHVQVEISGGSAQAIFGPYTASTVGTYNMWAHVEDRDQSGYQWQGGGWWGAEKPDIEVYQPNRPPTVSLSISGVTVIGGATGSLTIANGSTLTISSSSADLDGNANRLRVWVNVNDQGWTLVRDVPGTSDLFSYTFAGGGAWQIRCRSLDADNVESSPAMISATSNVAPSGLTLSGVSSTMRLGESLSLSSVAQDANANMTGHGFWVRGARTTDSFGSDGNGWILGPRSGQVLPNGWSNVSNSPNYSTPTTGANSTTSATFTPSAAGYWQLRANAWDPWVDGSGVTSAAVFVAPAPAATIQATAGSRTVQGGHALHVAIGQSIQFATTASASGWLSEHNLFGHQNGVFFSPPNGGSHLPAQNGITSSSRTVTWSSEAAGTFVLYSEAFTGRWPGDRVNGVSGSAGYMNDPTPETERITVVVYGTGDADGDGMDNLWEIQNGFSPNDPADAAQDADGDGLSNLQEYRLKTNPRQARASDPSGTQTGVKIFVPHK